jgi:hypothetical protein
MKKRRSGSAMRLDELREEAARRLVKDDSDK